MKAGGLSKRLTLGFGINCASGEHVGWGSEQHLEVK